MCGFRYPLRDLKYSVVNGKATGMRHCRKCYSPDHPQYHVNKRVVNDPQVVPDPRPDWGGVNARGEFGWNPVGNEQTYLTISLGDVTVEV